MSMLKKLLVALMLCGFSSAAFAQAGSVTVINSTNCTIYYYLLGAQAPMCGQTNNSILLSLPPGAVLNYPSSAAIPGFPAAPVFWISAIKIVSSPNPCNPAGGWMIGEPCSGFPPITPAFFYGANCQLCGNCTVRWFAAGTPGGTARVQFL